MSDRLTPEQRARLEEISNRAEAARGPIDAALATIDHLTTRNAELDQECQFSMKAIAQEQERAEKAEAEVERLTARCERLNAALTRQCDNMAFIVNHVDLNGWYEKCKVDLENDRAALTPSPPDQEPAKEVMQTDERSAAPPTLTATRPPDEPEPGACAAVSSSTPADEAVKLLREYAEQLDEDGANNHSAHTSRVARALAASRVEVAPALPADDAALVEEVLLQREWLIGAQFPDKATNNLIPLLERVAAALQASRRVGPSVEDVAQAARAHYEAQKPVNFGFSRSATWEEASQIEGWAEDQMRLMRAALVTLPGYATTVGGEPRGCAMPGACACPLDRARLISAMQEHLSCEYDSDLKGDASWRVIGIEAATDAILGEK